MAQGFARVLRGRFARHGKLKTEATIPVNPLSKHPGTRIRGWSEPGNVRRLASASEGHWGSRSGPWTVNRGLSEQPRRTSQNYHNNSPVRGRVPGTSERACHGDKEGLTIASRVPKICKTLAFDVEFVSRQILSVFSPPGWHHVEVCSLSGVISPLRQATDV